MRETLNFHLIGVGGVGMSALATLLFRLGHRVSGADRTLESANVRFLSSLGVKVFPDDGSGVDASVDEVVVSTAIEPSNPGLARARELGIKVTHRAAALAAALSSRKLVAVAGTCGKSTVTAMLGHILSECGRDPLCVNGANVPGWEGAVRFGAGEYAVAEVDESDRSLTAFRPYAAIVTNASADHYSKAEMDEVFDAFVKDVPGPVIDARGETYRPQDYNIQNASLAVRMAVALGCGRDEAERAMAGFGGVERRLQLVGRVAQLHDRALAEVLFNFAQRHFKRALLLADFRLNGGSRRLGALLRSHDVSPLSSRKLILILHIRLRLFESYPAPVAQTSF
jgi:UDP-N-acetylmuramate-alanine ligase